jgi:hypothetical protein
MKAAVDGELADADFVSVTDFDGALTSPKPTASVGFLAEDDPDLIPLASVVRDAGQEGLRGSLLVGSAAPAQFAEETANPMAADFDGGWSKTGDLLQTTTSHQGLFSTISAASTWAGAASGDSTIETIGDLAAKSGLTEKAIVAMSDEDLFSLLAEAGVSVLLKNRILSAVQVERTNKAAAKKTKKLKVRGAQPAALQEVPPFAAEARLQEIRGQLEEVRTSHGESRSVPDDVSTRHPSL